MGEGMGYKVIDLKKERRRKKFSVYFNFLRSIKDLFKRKKNRGKAYRKYTRKHIHH